MLGAVPKMIDSIIRETLSDAQDIDVISSAASEGIEDYDVLVLNTLEGEARGKGYNSPSPSSGIVMVSREARSAIVFRRLDGDLLLEQSARIALARAIKLAAGQG